MDFEQKFIDKAMEAREKRLQSEANNSSNLQHSTTVDADKDIIGDIYDSDNVPDEEKWWVRARLSSFVEFMCMGECILEIFSVD